MKTLVVENLRRAKKAVREIESKIKVKVHFSGDKAFINGNAVDEFTAFKIMRAFDFGFDIGDAMLLKNDDFCLEFICIKEHTKRKNLKDVRARVIGKNGRAKKTIENLTGSVIAVKNNAVGIICDSEHLDSAIQSICSLIQGAKHGNVFSYLEKQNAGLKKFDKEDLGLKNPKKDLGKMQL